MSAKVKTASAGASANRGISGGGGGGGNAFEKGFLNKGSKPNPTCGDCSKKADPSITLSECHLCHSTSCSNCNGGYPGYDACSTCKKTSCVAQEDTHFNPNDEKAVCAVLCSADGCLSTVCRDCYSACGLCESALCRLCSRECAVPECTYLVCPRDQGSLISCDYCSRKYCSVCIAKKNPCLGCGELPSRSAKKKAKTILRIILDASQVELDIEGHQRAEAIETIDLTATDLTANGNGYANGATDGQPMRNEKAEEEGKTPGGVGVEKNRAAAAAGAKVPTPEKAKAAKVTATSTEDAALAAALRAVAAEAAVANDKGKAGAAAAMAAAMEAPLPPAAAFASVLPPAAAATTKDKKRRADEGRSSADDDAVREAVAAAMKESVPLPDQKRAKEGGAAAGLGLFEKEAAAMADGGDIDDDASTTPALSKEKKKEKEKRNKELKEQKAAEEAKRKQEADRQAQLDAEEESAKAVAPAPAAAPAAAYALITEAQLKDYIKRVMTGQALTTADEIMTYFCHSERPMEPMVVDLVLDSFGDDFPATVEQCADMVGLKGFVEALLGPGGRAARAAAPQSSPQDYGFGSGDGGGGGGGGGYGYTPEDARNDEGDEADQQYWEEPEVHEEPAKAVDMLDPWEERLSEAIGARDCREIEDIMNETKGTPGMAKLRSKAKKNLKRLRDAEEEEQRKRWEEKGQAFRMPAAAAAAAAGGGGRGGSNHGQPSVVSPAAPRRVTNPILAPFNCNGVHARMHRDGHVVCLVDCPEQLIGYVIGKGGVTINTFKRQSGALVEMKANGADTKILIKGPPANAEKALKMVLAHLQSMMRESAPGVHWAGDKMRTEVVHEPPVEGYGGGGGYTAQQLDEESGGGARAAGAQGQRINNNISGAFSPPSPVFPMPGMAAGAAAAAAGGSGNNQADRGMLDRLHGRRSPAPPAGVAPVATGAGGFGGPPTGDPREMIGKLHGMAGGAGGAGGGGGGAAAAAGGGGGGAESLNASAVNAAGQVDKTPDNEDWPKIAAMLQQNGCAHVIKTFLSEGVTDLQTACLLEDKDYADMHIKLGDKKKILHALQPHRKQEKKTEEPRQECAVCMERMREVRLDTCGHFQLCVICVEILEKHAEEKGIEKQCPTCRAVFKSWLKCYG